MGEKTPDVVDKMWHRVWNAGELNVVDEILSPNYRGHIPAQPEIAGREPFKQMVATYRSAFPDVHVTVEDTISEADRIVIRWVSRATQTGDFPGIPATGRKIEISGISILKIADGVIVEEWEEFDSMGMMKQLGLMG